MKKTILLIDIQNDFLPGGSLAVAGSNLILPKVLEAVDSAKAEGTLVVASQDWHPTDHGSFAANHPGKNVFDMGELAGLPQVLWPVHCVQNTQGADLHDCLKEIAFDHIVKKGTDKAVDSYSAFADNGGLIQTDLHDYLQAQGVTELQVCGLATDYCVKATAIDARRLGYKVELLANLCRGVDATPGDVMKALAEMAASGVTITA